MDEKMLELVVNKRLEDAIKLIEENDYIPRITKKNGVPRVVTRDYVTHRINLVVNDGFVKRAYFG